MELQERRQWAFDMSARHLLKQGKPSYGRSSNGSHQCLYSGSGCAIAPFIPSTENRKVWDTYGGIRSMIELEPHRVIRIPDFIRDDVDFFAALQAAHDQPALSDPRTRGNWRDEWLNGAREVARDYGLDASVLDEGFARA